MTFITKIADADMLDEGRAVLRELAMRDALLAAGEPDLLETRTHLRKYDELRKAAALSGGDAVALIAGAYSEEISPEHRPLNYRLYYEQLARQKYRENKREFEKAREKELAAQDLKRREDAQAERIKRMTIDALKKKAMEKK